MGLLRQALVCIPPQKQNMSHIARHHLHYFTILQRRPWLSGHLRSRATRMFLQQLKAPRFIVSGFPPQRDDNSQILCRTSCFASHHYDDCNDPWLCCLSFNMSSCSSNQGQISASTDKPFYLLYLMSCNCKLEYRHDAVNTCKRFIGLHQIHRLTFSEMFAGEMGAYEINTTWSGGTWSCPFHTGMSIALWRLPGVDTRP